MSVGGTFADAAAALAAGSSKGDLVLTVGAGDVTDLASLVLSSLRPGEEA